MTNQIGSLILQLLNILSLALIARALLSWFDPRMNWGISRRPLRCDRAVDRADPPGRAAGRILDLSFIVAIVLIQVLYRLLATALLG